MQPETQDTEPQKLQSGELESETLVLNGPTSKRSRKSTRRQGGSEKQQDSRLKLTTLSPSPGKEYADYMSTETSKSSQGKGTPKSTRRSKLNSLPRGRALKRKSASFLPFDLDHIKYAWAAYKRGAFDAMPDLPEDMDALAFNSWFTGVLTPIAEGGGEVITMIGRTVSYGEIPLGVATLEYHGQIAYPHHIWYPDASPRNKLEITLAFLLELKKSYVGFVFAEKKDDNFFQHMGKFGVLRKVGRIYDWFGPKDHATLYQTVGN